MVDGRLRRKLHYAGRVRVLPIQGDRFAGPERPQSRHPASIPLPSPSKTPMSFLWVPLAEFFHPASTLAAEVLKMPQPHMRHSRRSIEVSEAFDMYSLRMTPQQY